MGLSRHTTPTAKPIEQPESAESTEETLVQRFRDAKRAKDFATADRIRDDLRALAHHHHGGAPPSRAVEDTPDYPPLIAPTLGDKRAAPRGPAFDDVATTPAPAQLHVVNLVGLELDWSTNPPTRLCADGILFDVAQALRIALVPPTRTCPTHFPPPLHLPIPPSEP